MKNIYKERLSSLRHAMRRSSLPAALIDSPISRKYMSGFGGSWGRLLIAKDKAILITDFRYYERAREETLGLFEIIDAGRDSIKVIKNTLFASRVRRLAIEDNVMSVARHEFLKKQLRRVNLVGLGDMILRLRAVKDDSELGYLRQAAAATDKTMRELLRWLKHLKRSKRLPSEEAVAWRVKDIIHGKRLGEPSFDPIIASGANAARPHHEPSVKKLKLGEMVIIDLGVKVNGYHADMTRTVFLGTPTTKQKRMYETTLRAQTAAISYLRRGGRRAKEADAVARRVIDAKFPGAFGHALGHGVGLEIHEHPKLAQNSKDVLKPNMVFSVEPGIYLPCISGVRIEDLVLLRKSSYEMMSNSPKTLSAVTLR